jgi:hypothetical protein
VPAAATLFCAGVAVQEVVLSAQADFMPLAQQWSVFSAVFSGERDLGKRRMQSQLSANAFLLVLVQSVLLLTKPHCWALGSL